MNAAALASAAALAGLNGMSPPRLRSLLDRFEPEVAWNVATGEAEDPVVRSWFQRRPALAEAFATSARARPPAEVWDACRATGTSVLLRGEPGYPAPLADDPDAPAVLFARGAFETVTERRVGIVGTRNATEAGRRLALRFGRDLAESGVSVVSGLARGIDGAAHRGVLAAEPQGGVGVPVAVVASGPDHPFPREHAELWEQVVDHGVVLSEHPPGAPPLAEWFPLRNRILAGLSEILVVVESRERGGSLVTARLAAERGIPVLAVPGSLLNRAAEGTNRLIADGATAVLDTLDLFIALGLETSRSGTRSTDHRRRPSSTDQTVLDAFAGDPLTLDQVALRCPRPLADVAVAVGRLETEGWLVDLGGWFQPVGATRRR